MNKGAKENWFQSPHISKNGPWMFHEDNTDLFNLTRFLMPDKQSFITPIHQSRNIDIEKYNRTPNNQSAETESNKFEDVNLPHMFSNTIIARPIINQKINFDDQSILQQDDDCVTPCNQNYSQSEPEDNYSKELPKTAAKERHKHSEQQKKTRPKEKGLRMLSQKAYDIVAKMNGATYKEVANKLVDQLAVQDTIQINPKQQQNIKRRVYDALNVLIALGTLKKEGRKIHGIKEQESDKNSRIELLKKLLEERRSKQLRIIEKMKVYKNSKTRAQTIRALIKRNRQAVQKQDKVEFPFIAFCIQSEDQSKVMVKKHEIQICSSQTKIEPFGDLDTLQYLGSSLKGFSECEQI